MSDDIEWTADMENEYRDLRRTVRQLRRAARNGDDVRGELEVAMIDLGEIEARRPRLRLGPEMARRPGPSAPDETQFSGDLIEKREAELRQWKARQAELDNARSREAWAQNAKYEREGRVALWAMISWILIGFAALGTVFDTLHFGKRNATWVSLAMFVGIAGLWVGLALPAMSLLRRAFDALFTQPKPPPDPHRPPDR